MRTAYLRWTDGKLVMLAGVPEPFPTFVLVPIADGEAIFRCYSIIESAGFYVETDSLVED